MSTAAKYEFESSVKAAVLKDCASRLRIVYRLPRPIELEELGMLAFGDIAINEFSRHVAGALDHFKFQVSEYSLANGSVGGTAIIVTYGKLGAEALAEDRPWVEKFLCSTYGPISVVP